MKIKILFAYIFIFFHLHSAAQNWQWAINLGGNQTENVNGLHLQVDRLYMTGNFNDSATFGNTILTSKGSADIFLVKCDTSGNVLWAIQAGGTGIDYGYSVTTDINHNIYLSGVFSDTIIINTDTLISAGSLDLFIAKYDSSGNPIWAIRAGGTADEYANSIKLDGFGNLCITGYFWGSSTFDNITINSNGGYDVFIAKYDTSGNVIWAKNAGGMGWDYCMSSAFDSNGNLFITGQFIGAANFDSITLTTTLGNAIFIAKYDSTGNIVWAKQAGGHYCNSQGNDRGYGIIADNSGNVLVTGRFVSDTACFDNISLTNNGSQDIFIAKYDPNGNILWAKQAGSSSNDNGRSVTVDASNNIYLTGFFSGTAAFGNHSLTSIAGWDVFIAKYDPAGIIQWVKQVQGTGLSNYAQCIASENYDNIYIAGGFSDNIAFDNINLNSNGWQHDIFLAKLGDITTSISSEVAKYDTIKVYPNPFRNYVIIDFKNRKNENCVLSLYSLTGELVLQVEDNSTGEIKLEKGTLNSGLYFFQLQNETGLVGRGKLIIE